MEVIIEYQRLLSSLKTVAFSSNQKKNKFQQMELNELLVLENNQV